MNIKRDEILDITANVADWVRKSGAIEGLALVNLHAESNTAAHLKAITTGTSQTLFIQNNRLLLGLWQCVYICEYDGP